MPECTEGVIPLSGTTVDPAPTVTFRGVHLSFDGEPVLDGVDLVLPPGRTTVLLGPSGVGKTTLVRTLVGLYAPGAGQVAVDGRSVAGLRGDELNAVRRDMGVLLGGSSVYDASLFGSLSVFENVAYPLRAAGVPAPEADRLTWQLLEEFDLVRHATALPSEVSAGERRRAALAKAVTGDPRLLVLDEPAPALDAFNRDRTLHALRRRMERSRCTAFVVTHDVDLARSLGDRVAVLLAGRIVADGPVAEVLEGVVDAAALEARFGFGEAPASHAECALAARRARRQGLAEAWLLMGVLVAMLTLLSVALASGMLANPAI